MIPPAAGGLQGSVVINPDIANPDIANPDIANPDIANAEVYNPDIANPDIANPDIANPDIANPDIANPDIANVRIVNPDIANPDIANPDIANPDIANPDIANPDIANGSITDASWTFTNDGNTTAAYAVKLQSNKEVPIGIKTQLIVHRIYTTPVVDGCQLKIQTQNILVANIPNPVLLRPGDAEILNPDIANPDIANATVSLAPGDTAQVTLRVVDPDRSDGITFDPASGVSPVAVAQSINTLDLIAGGTQPPVLITLTATSTALPTGNSGGAYSFAVQTTGGVGPFTFTVASGALPPGLMLDLNTGIISGTPTATGSFAFTVQVTDAQGRVDFQSLTLTVNAPGVEGFSPTGPLIGPNTNSGITLLADGTVLVTGGIDDTGTFLATGQIYDPTTGLSTATAGTLVQPRAGSPTVRLNDGRVLLVGGVDAVNALSTAEIYDPTTGMFTATGGVSVWASTAALLPDGRVLATGCFFAPCASEIYDPTAGTFSVGPTLNVPRGTEPITLADGRLLYAGGFGVGGVPQLASAEIYDPATGLFSLTGSMTVARRRFSAALLADGRVLIAGGETANGITSLAEIYDPATGTFTPTGSLNVARTRPGGFFDVPAPVLLDGRVLIAGGHRPDGVPIETVELFDPVTGTFSLTGSMLVPSTGPSAMLLGDGRVLIAGGRSGLTGATVTATAQLYTP